MSPNSQIAMVSQLLQSHLLAGFTPQAWSGAPPVLRDAPPLDATGDALLVLLYQVDPDHTVRQAPPGLGLDGRIGVAPLILDLHYLVVAHATAVERAHQLLECAAQRLHAEPLISHASLGEAGALELVPVTRPLPELLALLQALGMPPRPALCYQATLILEPVPA